MPEMGQPRQVSSYSVDRVTGSGIKFYHHKQDGSAEKYNQWDLSYDSANNSSFTMG